MLNSPAGQNYSCAIVLLQAAFDMIPTNERSNLLHKLVITLIKNATAANELDTFCFVACDLINRVDNSTITDPVERVIFASMNDKAGKKALTVPDFSR
jgi:ATP-dependent RNA helicase DDX31/DBP7